MKKRLITAADIRCMTDAGTLQLVVARGELFTPLALDTARVLVITLSYEADRVVAELPVWCLAAHRVPRKMPQTPPVAAPASPPPARQTDALETRVREVVAALLAKSYAPASSSPVRHITGRGLHLEPFPFDVGHPEMDIRVLDVVTGAHGSPVAGGIMSFRKGSFPWALNYDEIEYVIEGELHIGTSQGTVIGLPGDVLYVPKGTSITFGTPEWAKFFYVTYPAEWGG